MNKLLLFISAILYIPFLSDCCCYTENASPNLKAEKVSEIKAKLGEGSIWDYRRQILYWIDIEGGTLFEYNPVSDSTLSHFAGKKIGTIVPESDTSVILALDDGIYRMFLSNGSLVFLAKPSSLSDHQRFNDGKCDPAGRFWVGTMGPRNSCFLYCLDTDGIITEKLGNISTSNGIVWSPDSTKMYYTDTPTRKVRQFDYDAISGTISNEKVIIEVPDSLGAPDGMTIDSNGKLWIACWNGYGVYQYDPETGELLQKIDVPAKNITSCAFGGKNLDILYITSASIDMTEKDGLAFPEAGKLFSVKPGVNGIKANFIKLSK
jgi:sugar lactone lactonase YvrE